MNVCHQNVLMSRCSANQYLNNTLYTPYRVVKEILLKYSNKELIIYGIKFYLTYFVPFYYNRETYVNLPQP
jgi:hypothetical protein